MPEGCSSCGDLVRGGLSWPGVVVLWTGLWTLLDRHFPGGTGVWKELGLSVAGASIMIWTRTLFSNAGMDSLEYEGSLAELGSLLAQGRLRWRDKARFYFRSLLAIVGSILFWDGVYTLCDEYVWESTIAYNLLCAAFGGIGMVWVMTSEDEEPESGDGIDSPMGLRRAVVGTRLGGNGGHFARLPPAEQGRLYVKALFCNVCGVVFWKGVEEVVEDNGPDEDWTGIVLFLVGISVLGATERLSTNSGLDDGLPLAVEIHQPPVAGGLTAACGAADNNIDGGGSSSNSIRSGSGIGSGSGGGSYSSPGGSHRRSPPPLLFAGDGIVEDEFCPGCSWLLEELGGAFLGYGREERGAGEQQRRRRSRRRNVFPRWTTTAAELTGVVFAWTGLEWYVWDDDYISDTWLRDLVYIAVGLSVLLGTGTFFNLAGTISPVAALKQVHLHNRLHDESVPLLSAAADSLLSSPDASERS